MSYAQVTSSNREPISLQPHPDPALFNTQVPPVDVPAPTGTGTTEKVTVVPADYKEHPKIAADRIANELHEARQNLMESTPTGSSDNKTGSQKRKDRKERVKEYADEAEEEALEFWEKAQDVIMRPGVAGGILGIVNVGLLGTLSYKLYTEPGLRTDQRFLTTAAISTLALFGAEGYAAESYRQTDAGRNEERKARQEGAALIKQAKTVVLRPGVLGGIVGVVNLGILGGVGYWGWTNWDKPAWDRRTVSATTVGLIALFAGEGYLGEQYKEKEYPKHK